MDDVSDDELGGGGRGEYDFDAFTIKSKATRTLETYNDKIRRLVRFALTSEIYKEKVDTTKALCNQISIPLTV